MIRKFGDGLTLVGERGVIALALDIDHHDGSWPQFAEQDLLAQASPRSRAAWSGATVAHPTRVVTLLGEQLAWQPTCSSIAMSLSFRRSSSLPTMRSTMLTISSWLNWWKTMVSSIRFKNSGRKCCLSSCAPCSSSARTRWWSRSQRRTRGSHPSRRRDFRGWWS